MMRPVMTMKAIYDSRGMRTGIEDAAEGKFHGWGVEYEEFENGPGNFSVAIVEMPDGTVQTLMPFLVRFLDTEAAYQAATEEFIKRPITA